VIEVEEASNNKQNPEADGATGGAEETQPLTQEEGKETGSTRDTNLMEARGNEKDQNTKVGTLSRWRSALSNYCKIL